MAKRRIASIFTCLAVCLVSTAAMAQGNGPCPTCQNRKTVTCPACGGLPNADFECPDCSAGKIPCHECHGGPRCASCNGSGQVFYGQGRSGATLGCPVCGGKGDAPCTCKKGELPCPTCRGAGKIRLGCPLCAGKVRFPCPTCVPAEAAEACRDCKGTGNLQCPGCAGKGKAVVACDACKGQKVRVCTSCRSAGRKLCPKCQGSKLSIRGVDVGRCPECHGVGTKRCEACDGKKVTPCQACKGAGRAETPCWLCMGAKQVPCRSCARRTMWSGQDPASGAQVRVLDSMAMEPWVAAGVQNRGVPIPTAAASERRFYRIVLDGRAAKLPIEVGPQGMELIAVGENGGGGKLGEALSFLEGEARGRAVRWAAAYCCTLEGLSLPLRAEPGKVATGILLLDGPTAPTSFTLRKTGESGSDVALAGEAMDSRAWLASYAVAPAAKKR